VTVAEILTGAAFDVEQQARAALDDGDVTRALEVLMNAYGAPVFRYCSRMLGDPAAAEDALQTTFLQAFKDCRTFRDRSSMRTWLFGIAHHRCLDSLKSRRRKEGRCDPLDAAQETVDTAHDPETSVAAAQMRKAMAECLETLDPGEREPLLLRYQKELTYPEIAYIYGKRPAALQIRVARAMPKLRRCLEGKGIR